MSMELEIALKRIQLEKEKKFSVGDTVRFAGILRVVKGNYRGLAPESPRP
jgi:hypothetical protein